MIPDEAVEAAAKAIRDDDWPDYEDQLHRPVRDYMTNARAALKAAAPHMLAEAWDEGHDAAADEMAKYENPYRSQA